MKQFVQRIVKKIYELNRQIWSRYDIKVFLVFQHFLYIQRGCKKSEGYFAPKNATVASGDLLFGGVRCFLLHIVCIITPASTTIDYVVIACLFADILDNLVLMFLAYSLPLFKHRS